MTHTFGALCKLGTVKCGFCEKELSAASSLHLSDCTSRGRGITRRHHALRDELKNVASWAGKTTIQDGAYRPIGKSNKQPDLTIREWQGDQDLCIDVRVASSHKTPRFRCVIQTPTKTHSDPILDTLSPAHHARIMKRREYVDRRLIETDFNAGRDRDTPEEKWTLKQITLSDLQGEVIFLPASSSSGGGISPDISALLRSLASIALQNDRVLDANPLPLFITLLRKEMKLEKKKKRRIIFFKKRKINLEFLKRNTKKKKNFQKITHHSSRNCSPLLPNKNSLSQ